MSWSAFVEYMHELNAVSVFVRLFLATAFGAILGIDRARKHRPAGFRTHMLVCMGSCLVMLTNQFLQLQYVSGDPARLGAQVISGIGFLGAGTIIVTRRNQVVGLTTAAGLWASACIGLTIGSGFYSASIIGASFIMFIVVVMQGIDERLQRYSKNLQIYVEFHAPSDLSSLLSYAAQSGITINQVEMVEARNDRLHLGAIIEVRLPERTDHMVVLEQLRKVDGINFIGKV